MNLLRRAPYGYFTREVFGPSLGLLHANSEFRPVILSKGTLRA